MTKQIEWVHQELVNWGDWSRRDTIGAGYKCPLERIIKRRAVELKEATAVSNIDGTPNEDRALQIDSAIARLPNVLQRVAKLKYIAEVTNPIGAQRMKVSVPTYNRWICKLHLQLSAQIPRSG